MNPYQYANQSPTQFWDADGQDASTYRGTKFEATYDKLYYDALKSCWFGCSHIDPQADQVMEAFYTAHPDNPGAREYWSKSAWGHATERASKEVTMTVVGGYVSKIPTVARAIATVSRPFSWAAGKVWGAGKSLLGRVFSSGAREAPGSCQKPGEAHESADVGSRSMRWSGWRPGHPKSWLCSNEGRWRELKRRA